MYEFNYKIKTMKANKCDKKLNEVLYNRLDKQRKDQRDTYKVCT